MSKSSGFCPDWASSPGDTIADVLRQRGLSAAEFAQRMGETHDQVRELLEGRAAITIAVARRLEQVLGASVEFWMSRDFQYRQDVARIHKTDEEWLRELPIGDMIKFGWLSPVPHPSEEMAACLRFFGVPNVSAWRQDYAKVREMVAFRTSPSFDSRPGSVAAWLRQGEIESETIDCSPWDPARFRDSLSRIRSLTRIKDPGRFIPELQALCAGCGIAALVLRAPNGCRASGATRFLSPSKALLLLSFRHLSDDQFWFSFFHEAGHLLLHGQKGFFLEGIGRPATPEEREANDFAERILIPSEFRANLMQLHADSRQIIRFARRVGVSPGVIVGQLQYHKKIAQNQLNGLRRRFRWEP